MPRLRSTCAHVSASTRLRLAALEILATLKATRVAVSPSSMSAAATSASSTNASAVSGNVFSQSTMSSALMTSPASVVVVTAIKGLPLSLNVTSLAMATVCPSPISKEPPSSPGMIASSDRGGLDSTTLCSSGVPRRVWSVTSTSLVASVWCILVIIAKESSSNTQTATESVFRESASAAAFLSLVSRPSKRPRLFFMIVRTIV